MNIRKLAYDLYKTDWRQRIPIERQNEALKDY